MYNAVPPPPSLLPQPTADGPPTKAKKRRDRRRQLRKSDHEPSQSDGQPGPSRPPPPAAVAAETSPVTDAQHSREARQNLQELFDSWSPGLGPSDSQPSKDSGQSSKQGTNRSERRLEQRKRANGNGHSRTPLADESSAQVSTSGLDLPRQSHSRSNQRPRKPKNAQNSSTLDQSQAQAESSRANQRPRMPKNAQNSSTLDQSQAQAESSRANQRPRMPKNAQNSSGSSLDQSHGQAESSRAHQRPQSQSSQIRSRNDKKSLKLSNDNIDQQRDPVIQSSQPIPPQQQAQSKRSRRSKKSSNSTDNSLNQGQRPQPPRFVPASDSQNTAPSNQQPQIVESADVSTQQVNKKRRNRRKKSETPQPSNESAVLQTMTATESPIAISSNSYQRQDTATGTPSRDRRGPKREFFDMYLAPIETDIGIRNGTMYLGTLRINPRRRRMAYVVVDGLEHDVIVIGSRDRNRALQGDTVIVEILGELTREQFDEANSGSGLIKSLAAKQKKEDAVVDPSDIVLNVSPTSAASHALIMDECEEEDEDESTLHKIGRVVRINERRPGMTYSGFLMHPRWKPGMHLEDLEDVQPAKDVGAIPSDVGNDEESDINVEVSVAESEITSQLEKLKLESTDDDEDKKKKKKKEKKKEEKPSVNCFFKPMDMRAPLLQVSMHDCPKDLEENYFTHYADKLFIATFDRWSHTAFHPYGLLGKLVGSMGEILAETEAILETNCIRTDDFDAKVVKCLPIVPWTIPEDEIAARKDLRETRIFTIDPETARDLDDAVSCAKLPDGNYKIGVHIADVSYFVKPKTALDDEAQKRATTTYLVQKAIPMLPSVLCEDLCSLNPGVDRLAFSVEWVMTPDAQIVETWFGRTVIRSCIKMSYENAQNLIDDKPWEEALNGKEISGKHTRQEVIDDVKIFYQLSQILRRRRFANGALTINQPKLTFRLDDTMHPIHCSVYEIKDSNRLIEEFMLLANISVARKISDYFPEESLLRNHPPPSSKALSEFLDYAARMGHVLDGSSAGALQRSIELIDDEETRQIFQLLAIKPMQRATYFCTGTYANELDRWRHFALNFPVYTHFTSPIRRYADVIVHRLLQAVLDQEDQPILTTDQVVKIAKHCNTKKEDARAAQDASSKLFLCVYLQTLAREIEDKPLIEEAIVMECGEKTFNVYIPRFALDRKVYLEDCDVLKVDIDARRTEMKITWPKEYRGLPPYEGAKPETPPVVQNTDGTKSVQFQPATKESGTVETIRMLKHVYVRLTVTKKSPLDVKAYLIHPEYPVKQSSMDALKVETDEQPTDECYLLEQFNQID